MDDTTIRNHYDRITPVVEELADLDGSVTLGNDDFVGWYVKRDCSDSQARAEGYTQEGRATTLSHDWDTIRDRMDRVLYAITSYKDPHALIDWVPCKWDEESSSTEWAGDKPTPDYGDMDAIALWGDIDLRDDLKPQRGALDEIHREVIEQTLAAYAEEFAYLYGSEEAVFALDSVGGAYVMGAPAATAPIADHFADDRDARRRVMEKLVERSNDWLEEAQERVERRVAGAADLIDPDWVNNKNRAYKAPLSIHKDHDAVVTPMKPFDPSYVMTPIESVDDDLVTRAEAWAEGLTGLTFRGLAGNLVENLWPDHVDEHDDWRVALEEWVQKQRAEEAKKRPNHDPAAAPSTASTDSRITPDINDVYRSIDDLDAEQVAADTIVSTWTSRASGKTDNSGDSKRAFIPIWGTMSDSGTANYVHEKGVWNDTGANDYGTVVEMALITEENWPRGKIAEGEDWARGVAHLRDLGYDIPVHTPDATSPNVDDEKMPYWSLRQAALALGVCDEEDLIDDEDAGYLRMDADTYNAALEAVEDAGLEHGREKVDTSGGSSGSSSGGSDLYDLTVDEALLATHPNVEPPQEINLSPPDKRPGTVQVREDADGVELYDPAVNGGYSYHALSWLAVNADARNPMHPSGRFSDYELWAAWRLAKEKGAIRIHDPMPHRARLHIAREHDLAPQELIANAREDPTALPTAVYNRIIRTVDEEYGLNPGLDERDVEHAEQKRAEMLEGGEDQDKDAQIKRMLATLDETSK